MNNWLNIYKYVEPVSGAEFAKTTRVLDNKPFTYTQTPFFEEITNAACDLVNNYEVVICCPAQLGKSTTIENTLLYYTNNNPGNALLICDTLKTSQRMAKNRLRSVLNRFTDVSNMSSGERIKDVMNMSLGPGYNLIVGCSNSASDLCSTPSKYLFADELDRWADELKDEGDPLTLARKRQTRFRGMALLTSTPTTENGRILTEYRSGTQETWCAFCNCGHAFCGCWSDFTVENNKLYMICPDCGVVYNENDIISLKHGYTQPANQNPSIDKFGRVKRSFRIYGGLCHSVYPWENILNQYLDAEIKGDAALRGFFNTTLAENYTPKAEKILDLNVFVARARTCPKPKQIYKHIVAGVDTHDNGFYITKFGVTHDGRFEGLKHEFIGGQLTTPRPWAVLDECIKNIDRVCIDSGGHFTQDVYAFCVGHSNCTPVKGLAAASNEAPFLGGFTKVKFNTLLNGHGTTRLLTLGVNAIKDNIYNWITDFYDGKYEKITFDSEQNGFNANYFSMLYSEKPVALNGGNRWQKFADHNESWDCLVYAFAASLLIDNAKGDSGVIRHIKESRNK